MATFDWTSDDVYANSCDLEGVSFQAFFLQMWIKADAVKLACWCNIYLQFIEGPIETLCSVGNNIWLLPSAKSG